MLTVEAVLHGKRDQLLAFDPAEHPLALQLGGADPVRLAVAARIGAERGFDEINLNVGCPSDRVQLGRFGACLMAEPELVGECVAAMQAAVGRAVPVTVKCRIGIDDQDSEADFDRFIETVGKAGCRIFIVHARKAWLTGLSPKENREIPPLDYGRVHRLKRRRPDLTIVLNGGLTTIEEALGHLAVVDGVMLGRAAYQNPYLLAAVDRLLFADEAPPPSRAEALERLVPYAARHLAAGGRISNITRHILGLLHGMPRARAYRRHLSVAAPRTGAGLEVLHEAIAIARGEALAGAAAG